MKDLLQELNQQQREACLQIDGPLLLLAGAGSGKTKTLTHRLARIIELDKAYPWELLAVTFTNKAAGEMRDRLEKLIGPDGEKIWAMTFHALCVRILRRSGKVIGLPTNFAIADTDDCKKVIREILQKRLGDDDKLDPSEVSLTLKAISRFKNNRKTIGQLRNSNDEGSREMANIWAEYQKSLLASGSVDFDDLLILAGKVLETPEGAKEWASKFKYVMVDEYQDVNDIQEHLMQLLASHRNICVVGDDDQSIYAFRGAQVEHILKFQKRWTGTKIIKLETNYRSSANVIEAANAVISKNIVRSAKQLIASRERGIPVRMIECSNSWAEADWTVKEVQRLKQQGIPLNRMAIVYRTNSQSRVFEERLNSRSIDYHIVGGLEFYRRAEVKTARSYLSLLANENDRLAFERAISNPRRGVGQVALDQLKIASSRDRKSLLSVSTRPDIKASAKTKKALEDFGGLFVKAKSLPANTSLVVIAKQVFKDSGLLDMYKRQKDGGVEQLGNLSELENLIARFKGPWRDALQEFLEHSALVEAGRGKEGTGISLMTIHATKGLEFDTVFLVGSEEELFLGQDSAMTDVEEARRLLYVGMTRAERYLVILYAKARMRWGHESSARPLRFLKDLPKSIKVEDYDADEFVRSRSYGDRKAKTNRFSQERGQIAQKPATKTQRPAKIQPRKPVGDLKQGSYVSHPKFGAGVVLSITGSKANIAFKDKTRSLVTEYAPLTVIR